MCAERVPDEEILKENNLFPHNLFSHNCKWRGAHEEKGGTYQLHPTSIQKVVFSKFIDENKHPVSERKVIFILHSSSRALFLSPEIKMRFIFEVLAEDNSK